MQKQCKNTAFARFRENSLSVAKSRPRRPRSRQDGPREAGSSPGPGQERPKSRQEGPRRPETTQKQHFLQGFVKIAFGGQEPPKTPQRRPKKPPGRPQSGREQPRDGPREAQEPPRVTPRCAQGPPGPAKELPRSSLEEAQEGSEAPGAARSPKMALRRPKMGPKRGPGEAQKRPRGGPAYDTRGHKSREAKARRYKWRQDNRRQDQRQDETTN